MPGVTELLFFVVVVVFCLCCCCFFLQYFFEFIILKLESLHLRRKYQNRAIGPLLPAVYSNRDLGRKNSFQLSGIFK